MSGVVRPIRQALAWRIAAVALLCAAPAAAQQRGAPAAGSGQIGTTSITSTTVQKSADREIVNVARALYQDANGNLDSASATSVVAIGTITPPPATAGVRLVPPREAIVAPGTRHAFAHTLTNAGTAPDAFRLDASADVAWPLAIWHDVDGDGALSAADTLVRASVPLPAGASAALLLVVDVPADAPADAVARLRLSATSGRDATVRATIENTLTVVRPKAQLSLGKSASKLDAQPGDTVGYTLTVANMGGGASGEVVVTDTLPAGLHYVAGSLVVDGQQASDDVGQTADGRDVVRVTLATVPAGTRLTFGFTVVLGAEATGTVRNVAVLTHDGESNPSTPADVKLGTVPLSLAKAIVGDSVVKVGDEVTYVLRVRNGSSALTSRGATLVDSLPASLRFVRAEGREGGAAPTVEGQVLTWQLGAIGPGAADSILLVARVAEAPADGRIVNVAVVQGLGGKAMVAHAAAVVEGGRRLSRLAVAKTAGILEAGPGDAIPYTVVVRNNGETPLADLVVRDRLPAGVRLAGTVVGADSSRVEGSDLVAWLARPLAPGAERTLRYGVVVSSAAGGRELRNVVTATAERGTVAGDSATAVVQLRRGSEVQGRTLVGTVWLDANEDGRQQPDERGVKGVRILSADGESVVTDAAGRFSFRDVRPGSHAFRLDTLALAPAVGAPRASAGIVVVRTDGWTMPRVSFRLVPRAAASRSSVPAPTGAPPRSNDAAPAAVDQNPGDAGDTTAMRREPAAAESPRDTTGARELRPQEARRDSASAAASAVAVGPTDDAVRVAPLRSDSARAADARQAFVVGVAPRIFSPADGAVVWVNRLFIGVNGEAGRTVRLYDGDSLVATDQVRPDGVTDFINVAITPGPHRFRVALDNSFGTTRWDSVAVHYARYAASIAAPESPVALRTDAAAERPARVRVLDRWGVPVAEGYNVTVEATGVVLEGLDSDRTSRGEQRRVGAGGWLALPLRGSRTAGPGSVKLTAYGASAQPTSATVAVRTLPQVRPLVVTGMGQVGTSGAGGSFGVVTASGAVDERTAVTVSVDSRRRDRDALFGRDVDPLDASRYPAMGDASERRVAAATTGAVAVKVERDFDWVEVGDVQPTAFGGGSDALLTYRRSLTGVNARVGTGDVTWQAFGSVTSQRLEQRQLRATGGSGPFVVGGGIRPGTERVFVEVRARDNAARVVDRRELTRVVDYEISYETGTLLLRRAVPSVDMAENPIFVVALVERQTGGEARLVGGVRAEVDAGRRLGLRGRDSLSIGASVVRDAAGQSPAQSLSQSPALVGTGALPTAGSGMASLVGMDLTARRGGLEARAEVLRADVADSSAIAGRAALRWQTRDERYSLGVRWMHVGEGFGSTFDPRLGVGVDELQLGGAVRLGDSSRAEIVHRREQFAQYGVTRATTTARTEQRLGGRTFSQEVALMGDETAAVGLGPARSGQSLNGKLRMSQGDGVSLWVEGQRTLEADGDAGQPDRLGVGASWKIASGASLEATHQRVQPRTGDAYELSALRIRTGGILGGKLWGGIERADAVRASHSAVLGMEERFRIGKAWSFESMLERRMGLERAPLADPVRALPFAQPESDHWAGALGLDFAPGADRPHATLRGELRDATEQSSWRLSFSADAPLGTDAALLVRSDWGAQSRSMGLVAGQGGDESRQDRSLVGLALRPGRVDGLDLLAKLEWRRTMNPLAGSSFADASDQRRLIGATDAIWSFADGMQFAARYALRWAEWRRDASENPLAPLSHFVGLRAERALARRLSVRMDGRLLAQNGVGGSAWSVAPSLLQRLTDQVHVELGYRLGTLRDVDFGAEGDRLYLLLAVRFTEGDLGGPAAFWRERIAREER